MDVLPEDAPAPRLCHLIKWPDFDGYGFNLHAERSNPGQFIGKIDEDSPAQMAGLREGDRIVEVNGVNISNENHRQVVERIKSEPLETKLLVVDPPTDAWYREHELVIKSSQLNVVYAKTPTPRPQADSPRAKFHQQQAAEEPAEQSSRPSDSSEASEPSQTETSAAPACSLSPSTLANSLDSSDSADFVNEDSIEPAGAHQSPAPQAAGKHHSPAPMSPDSGKGDEEPANVLTIEAEINRQSPVKQLHKLELQQDEQQQQQQQQQVEAQDANKSTASERSSSPSIQPDSLAQAEHQVKQADDRKISHEDTKEPIGSADSGQSSSSDSSSSSGNESIVDSLDEQPQRKSPTGSEAKSADWCLEDEKAQTIKNYKSVGAAAAAMAANKLTPRSNSNSNSNSINNNNDDDTSDNNQTNSSNGNETTMTKHNSTPMDKQDVASGDEQQVASKQPLKSALANKGNIATGGNSANINSNMNNISEDSEQPHTPKSSATPAQNTGGGNNNYSGLNLNMTASEMRQLIARRKKFDPKKAQMNIRQKYEIIQQM